MNSNKKLFFAIIFPIAAWLIPSQVIPIPDLTVIEHRLIAIFIFAALFWVLEPIPVYATSIMVIVLLLVTISDKSFILFQLAADAENYGTPIPYGEIMATFASPVIMLFLGGFFLAMAATKYRLDTNFIHGMNAYVVAMIPVGVFSATSVINHHDLRNIKWDVLWLVAGGLALGMALENTGLAKNVIDAIPFGLFSPLLIVAFASLLAIVMSNFISNTATANLLLPLMVALGTGLPALYDAGGLRYILLTVTFACSLGMAMPISTPPNAIAHGSSYFETADMMKTGVIVGGVGLFLAYSYIYALTVVFDIL